MIAGVVSLKNYYFERIHILKILMIKSEELELGEEWTVVLDLLESEGVADHL